MKKALLFIFVIILSFLVGCRNIFVDPERQEFEARFISSGDFLYQIVEINDEGLQIVEASNNKNCVERFARIRGLSKNGKKKEILIVPESIDGLKVKEVAAYIDFDSKVLRRFYIPFEINIWGYGSGRCTNAPKLKKVVKMRHDVATDYYSSYIISSYNRGSEDLYQIIGQTHQLYANVSFRYNYEDAPNYGYYWIDSYLFDNLITYVPANPAREGYAFDGWYKEAECINKWNFEIDSLPDIKKDEEGKWLFQETILYAKWVKKK